MLEPLDRLGLAGLVVLPGTQRKPFAFARRLVGPRDFLGAKSTSTSRSWPRRPTGHSAPRRSSSRSGRWLHDPTRGSTASICRSRRSPAGVSAGRSPTTSTSGRGRSRSCLPQATGGSVRASAKFSKRQLDQRCARPRSPRDQEQRDLDAVPDGVDPIFSDEDDLVAMREAGGAGPHQPAEASRDGGVPEPPRDDRRRQADRWLVTANSARRRCDLKRRLTQT